MSRWRVIALTVSAMIAFAGNSLLCRAALRQNAIDAATFTAIRIGSGAAVLWLVCAARRRRMSGNWISAGALFFYAAAFSFAYVNLAAGTGALLLFAAVQATMIATGLYRGERLRTLQWIGVASASLGLVFLLLPGLAAPPPLSASFMFAAGVAWGIYSLRGKAACDALAATAGNFARALLIALAIFALGFGRWHATSSGLALGIVSGAITSGFGYVIWYAALPALRATTAATVQLSAPVIAATGGVLLLGEVVTVRLLLASIAVLGGIALAITTRQTRPASR